MLAFMAMRSAFIHIAVAEAVGALVAAFTPARWVAALLWVSAAMLINGAVATFEDARSGGFDNPDGTVQEFQAGADLREVADLLVRYQENCPRPVQRAAARCTAACLAKKHSIRVASVRYDEGRRYSEPVSLVGLLNAI